LRILLEATDLTIVVAGSLYQLSTSPSPIWKTSANLHGKPLDLCLRRRPFQGLGHVFADQLRDQHGDVELAQNRLHYSDSSGRAFERGNVGIAQCRQGNCAEISKLVTTLDTIFHQRGKIAGPSERAGQQTLQRTVEMAESHRD